MESQQRRRESESIFWMRTLEFVTKVAKVWRAKDGRRCVCVCEFVCCPPDSKLPVEPEHRAFT